MTRWDAARARSRELRRKYKPVGPVGEKLDATPFAVMMEAGSHAERRRAYVSPTEVGCCVDCGYHVCSCERQKLSFTGGGEKLPTRVNLGRNCLRCGILLPDGVICGECATKAAAAVGNKYAFPVRLYDGFAPDDPRLHSVLAKSLAPKEGQEPIGQGCATACSQCGGQLSAEDAAKPAFKRPYRCHVCRGGPAQPALTYESPVGKVEIRVSENVPKVGPLYMFTKEGIKKP